MKSIIILLCMVQASCALWAQNYSESPNDPLLFPDAFIFQVRTPTGTVNISGVIQDRIDKDVYRLSIGPLNTTYVINLETGEITTVSNPSTEAEGRRRNTRLLGMIVYQSEVGNVNLSPGTNVIIGIVGRRIIMGQVTRLRSRRGFQMVLFGEPRYWVNIRNYRITDTNLPGYYRGDRVHMLNVVQEALRKRY